MSRDISQGALAELAEFRAGAILFRRAKREDDAELRALLRDNDMDSWVNFAFEREPSFFDGENLAGKSVAVIALDEKAGHAPIGMYTCSVLPAHINGHAESAGYLGGLRVNRTYRRRIRILKNGFASIPALLPDQKILPCWFTSVGEENSRARRILDADLEGMPRYRFAGAMETLAFSSRQAKSSGLLQRATFKDIPALVDFFNKQACSYQFSPVLDEAWLLTLNGKQGLSLEDFLLLKDGGDLLGCMAVWDQRKFKQTVVRGYRFPLNKFRSAYNLFARARGGNILPAAGAKLEQAFLSFFALDSRAHGIAVDIVKEGLLRVAEKNASIGCLGLSDKNPLTGILKTALHADCYRTRIETVAWPGDRLPELDGRPVQPEVAVL
jgi:hypothetical protein